MEYAKLILSIVALIPIALLGNKFFNWIQSKINK